MKLAERWAVILGVAVLLAGGHAAQAAGTNGPILIAEEYVYAGKFAALRLTNMVEGLAQMTEWRFKELTFKHHIKGVVLDLRSARGEGYAEAAAVADLFLAAEKPLASVDGRTLKSTAKNNALTMPVVVLMNRETAGAAELLAALLRKHRVALLLGSPTAGQKLKKILLAGGEPLPADGLQPDITEEVSPANEKIYFANAYAEIPAVKSTNAAPAAGVSTNKPPANRRLNEAELVRRQREGQTPDEDAPLAGVKSGAARAEVRDPVLARALGLLQGLAVAKQARAL